MDALKQQAKRLVASARVAEPMPTFCLAQDSVEELENAVDLSDLVEEIENDTSDTTAAVRSSQFIQGTL